MSTRNPPDTAPLGVNVYVWATDGKREKLWPNCKRFFTLGSPRFIGLPDGWTPVAWSETLDASDGYLGASDRC